MPSNSNTQTLVDLLEDSCDAIRAKDGTSAAIPAANIPARIAALPTGMDMSQVTGIAFNLSGKTTLDVTGLDTSAMTNGQRMFAYKANENGYSSQLTTITGLNSLDMSSMTDFSSMFANQTSLTGVSMPGRVTSSATTLNAMFNACSALANVDVTGWNTSNVTDITKLFYSCSSIQHINFAGWNTSSVTTFDTAFQGASALISLNLQGWTADSATSMGNLWKNASRLAHVIWAIDYQTVKTILPNAFDKNSSVSSVLFFYVRDSLLTAYQSDANFSRYSAQLKPISELPVNLQTLYNIDPNDYQ